MAAVDGRCSRPRLRGVREFQLSWHDVLDAANSQRAQLRHRLHVRVRAFDGAGRRSQLAASSSTRGPVRPRHPTPRHRPCRGRRHSLGKLPRPFPSRGRHSRTTCRLLSTACITAKPSCGVLPATLSTWFTATVEGLACGTSYSLGVAAADASGNVSSVARLDARTSECFTSAAVSPTLPTPPSPPSLSGDAQAPTTPGALAAAAVSQSSVTLSWQARVDNVGVAGYIVAHNGTPVADTSETAYTVGGLGCGSSYTFSVTARDAQGNRSLAATVVGATDACSAPPTGGGTGAGAEAAVFLSPSGSDSAGCVRGAPCRSFERAYRVAQPGSGRELAPGDYGSQRVDGDPSKTSAEDVVFRPADGRVVLNGLDVYGSHLTVPSLVIGAWTTLTTPQTMSPSTASARARSRSTPHRTFPSSAARRDHR